MKKVFVIIVTYKGKKWYDKCFGSLQASHYPCNVVVVDNASNDGSIEYISNLFPEVAIIPSNENLGFAKANNIGIKFALDNGADYVFLLNQDAWVEPNTIGLLLETFDKNNNVGIASPMHLNGAGSGLDLNFASFLPKVCVSDFYMQSISNYYPCNFVNAAAWMISRTCIEKVGGFDTLLFTHYGEDDNYAQRTHYHGFDIVVNTQCKIYHDRENRTGPRTFNTDFVDTKIALGNVNAEVNIPLLIKTENKKMFFKALKLRFAKSKQHAEIKGLYRQIEASREVNKRGGLVWLQ
ncbi:MAG: glycosyltransferase family 2 protein [Bacteroidales bacterium]|nr:glycosyltransferase family 2 protein [Bacteroidales bacterium]